MLSSLVTFSAELSICSVAVARYCGVSSSAAISATARTSTVQPATVQRRLTSTCQMSRSESSRSSGGGLSVRQVEAHVLRGHCARSLRRRSRVAGIWCPGLE